MAAPKTLGNSYSEKRTFEFLFHTISQMQSTGYYWTKNSTIDTFVEVLRENTMKKLSKIPKKSLQYCPFFYKVTVLLPAIFDFNKNRFHNKCFL